MTAMREEINQNILKFRNKNPKNMRMNEKGRFGERGSLRKAESGEECPGTRVNLGLLELNGSISNQNYSFNEQRFLNR